MKIEVNLEKFRETLAIANHGASKKAAMPILSNVLLATDHKAGILTITGTTLDLSIAVSMEAKCDEDAAFCLHGQRTVQIANAIDGTVASIELTNTRSAVLKCSGSRYTLATLPGEEFPPHSPVTSQSSQVFEQVDLKKRFSAVSPAQSDDPSRYILAGVYISQQKNVTDFVATDGRRLHYVESKGDAEQTSSLIMPSESVAKLCALLGDKGKVTFSRDARNVSFSIERDGGNISFRSKIVEGNYPNWQQVVPKELKSPVIVVADELAQAIRRVPLACDEKRNSVCIEVQATVMTLTASSSERGEAVEIMACENAAGISTKVAVNPGFLIDALTATPTEKATLFLKDSVSPIVIQSDDFTAIVMPVRLQ
jgi:DNA polymerase-3 subunit beta